MPSLHRTGDPPRPDRSPGLPAAPRETVTGTELTVRDARPDEFAALGRLLVGIYSTLDGFPTPAEQPRYYELLASIGDFADRPGARVLAALTRKGELVGAVVYFGEMAEYGSGATACAGRDASGIRLLGVDAGYRGMGAGRMLTLACIDLAREEDHAQVIVHTTAAMPVAWGLYERLGFRRAPELDFAQQTLPVFGFRLKLK